VLWEIRAWEAAEGRGGGSLSEGQAGNRKYPLNEKNPV